MKIAAILLLVLSLLPGCSRTASAKRHTQEDRPKSFFGTPLATDAEKAEVTKVVTSTLAKHVTFRPNGTASTIHSDPNRHHVEWMNLKMAEIHFQTLTKADTLNGVAKRFLVSLQCDAHRVWDDKKSAWSDWKPINYLLFPSALNVELKSDVWIVEQADRLKSFIPGPS
jgi:hypothetical protein